MSAERVKQAVKMLHICNVAKFAARYRERTFDSGAKLCETMLKAIGFDVVCGCTSVGMYGTFGIPTVMAITDPGTLEMNIKLQCPVTGTDVVNWMEENGYEWAIDTAG